jgi:hypothetical protein
MVKGSRGNRLLNEEELEPWTSGFAHQRDETLLAVVGTVSFTALNPCEPSVQVAPPSVWN